MDLPLRCARTLPRTMSKRANSKPENGHGRADVALWPNWYGWSWSAAPAPSLLSPVDGVLSGSAIRAQWLNMPAVDEPLKDGFASRPTTTARPERRDLALGRGEVDGRPRDSSTAADGRARSWTWTRASTWQPSRIRGAITLRHARSERRCVFGTRPSVSRSSRANSGVAVLRNTTPFATRSPYSERPRLEGGL
jgi:hypothetical protein